MEDHVQEAAKELFSHVKDNNIKQVEACLKDGSLLWRDAIRFQFPTLSMMEYVLKGNPLIPKLVACEIVTLSSFHLAAMLGFNDILVNFVDKDVPVDLCLESGTTALHLASFAGHVSTVKMLVDIYKAELDKQDSYGWSSLHYASIEGHMEVVKTLVGHGADIHIRDKDGTSAAFRAEINGHKDLIACFCHLGEAEELLNISDQAVSADPAALYSKVNKAAKTKNGSTNLSAMVPPPEVPTKGDLFNGDSTHQKLFLRQQSEPKIPAQRPYSEVMTSSTGPVSPHDPRSATMPSSNKQKNKKEVRRLIRKEIVAAFSDYQLPENAQGQDVLESALGSGVGMHTLKGIMREELVRYKMEQDQSVMDVPIPRDSVTSGDYEDVYNTLKDLDNLPDAPEPPTSPQAETKVDAPPLPPRNEVKAADERGKDLEDLFGRMTIGRGETSAALDASMRKLAPLLGTNWKRLAHALPIDINTARVVERIKAIERTYPQHLDKQAAVALVDWRINRGKRADVDCLILALRKCGLHDLIAEVERMTQEFTA